MQKSIGWLLIVGFSVCSPLPRMRRIHRRLTGPTEWFPPPMSMQPTRIGTAGVAPARTEDRGRSILRTEQVRYTNATGYKLRGTVGPQGALDDGPGRTVK